MSFTSLIEIKNHARAWLFDSAGPLWSTQGILDSGLFAERIGVDGKAIANLNCRLRVQARQIYSFCTLGRMGWDGPWREVASSALDHLLDHGISDGQCAHLFSPQAEVIDRSRDLYDHAFMLFALAHAATTLNRPELLLTANAIRERMIDWKRAEGGYWEGELTPCPPYRQNPHMHMFEAALFHQKIGVDPVWSKMVDELSSLFRSRFRDTETGAVTEYFDKNWSKLDDETGKIVEPGHCLEWSWLFYIAFRDEKAWRIADRLTDFARGHGICAERDVAINEVYLDGTVRAPGARLWPQTERLKAAIARYQRGRGADEADEIIRAYRGLTLYWDTPVRGNWWDRLETDGSFIQEAAPASSFYHIVCALFELHQL